MAHKGRMFRLHPTRVWNAQASYPFWAPFSCTLRLPPCTGILFDELNDLQFNNCQGIHTPTGLIYTGSTSFPLRTLDIAATCRVGWRNTETDAREFDFRLDGHYYPLGLPPRFWTLAIWYSTFTNVAQAMGAVIPLDFVADVVEYFPFGDAEMLATLWFL